MRHIFYSLLIFISLFPLIANAKCKEHIEIAEIQYQLPTALLASISRVESNFHPYAINVEGKPYHFKDKLEAIDFVQKELDRGITSIDVGCMQINYKYHSINFSSLDEMFDPKKNVNYGAKYLKSLYEEKKKRNWYEAVARYHSPNPLNQKIYTTKVAEVWFKSKAIKNLVKLEGKEND